MSEQPRKLASRAGAGLVSAAVAAVTAPARLLAAAVPSPRSAARELVMPGILIWVLLAAVALMLLDIAHVVHITR